MDVRRLAMPVLVVALTALLCSSAPASTAAAPQAELMATGLASPNIRDGMTSGDSRDISRIESLSDTAENLHAVSTAMEAVLQGNPDFSGVGYQLARGTLLLYWSGPMDSPALVTALSLAKSSGVRVTVAHRAVTLAQIEAASQRLLKSLPTYESRGIHIVTFGGFSADVDAFTVMVDDTTPQQVTPEAIEMLLESELGVPVKVTLGSTASQGRVGPRWDE